MKADGRTRMLNVRLSKDERDMLHEAAAREGVSMSSIVRSLVRATSKMQAFDVYVDVPGFGLRKLHSEAAKKLAGEARLLFGLNAESPLESPPESPADDGRDDAREAETTPMESSGG